MHNSWFKYYIVSVIFLTAMFLSCNSRNEGKENENENRKNEILAAANKYKQGSIIFDKYCSSCHLAPEKDAEDAYTFDNIFNRMPSPSESYFISFIHDSKSLKYAGDQYATAIDRASIDYEHAFGSILSAEQGSTLVFYIKIAEKMRRTR